MIVPVLVVRCGDHPKPPVPSKVVLCSLCDSDCWMSIYSGDSTLAVAASMGTPAIICTTCFWPLIPRELGKWN